VQIHIVYTKINGDFDDIKSTHLYKEDARTGCVKALIRQRPEAKLILSDSGAETDDGQNVAIIVTRTLFKN
jgi:hypothetical protein